MANIDSVQIIDKQRDRKAKRTKKKTPKRFFNRLTSDRTWLRKEPSSLRTSQ